MKKDNNLMIASMLAWRNIWKNKRRTIITFLTTVVGCCAIIFMNASNTGFSNNMIKDKSSLNHGHIQILAKGFWEKRGVEYAFVPDEKLIKTIENDKDIEGYSKRILAGGLMSFRNNTVGVMVQGIDPIKDKTISNIYNSILPGGRFLKSGDMQHIIIGETLAKKIRAKIGDQTVIISNGLDGSIAAERLTIVGIYKSGNLECDGALIIMPIKQAAETFSMNDNINSIVIKIKNIDAVYNVRERLLKNIDTSQLDVLGWKELMPDIVQLISTNNSQNLLMVSIFFPIVVFTILNVIQMSVFERIREFGVMLALGTRPGQITAMILFESFYIALIGVILGGISAGLVCRHFFINPVNLTALVGEMPPTDFSNSTSLFLQTDMTLLNLFVTAILIIIISTSFSIIPARKAARLSPVEAIRHL